MSSTTKRHVVKSHPMTRPLTKRSTSHRTPPSRIRLSRRKRALCNSMSRATAPEARVRTIGRVSFFPFPLSTCVSLSCLCPCLSPRPFSCHPFFCRRPLSSAAPLDGDPCNMCRHLKHVMMACFTSEYCFGSLRSSRRVLEARLSSHSSLSRS